MKYEINDIERLTGIKAHTLRIWEKRYSLVAPHRTQTNIRFYDDAQAKKLMNVCTLVNAGKKISKIAKLSDRDIDAEVYLLQISGSEQNVSAAMILQLTTAMLDFDQDKFETLLDKVIDRFGVRDGIVKVIYPFLENVGVLWSTNESMPAQEHFASCLIRNKLIVETEKLPKNDDAKKVVLLFLPPNEYHEIGLLLTNYMVRSMQMKTIYLGAAVPFENVITTCERLHPTHLVSFFIMHKKRMDIPAEFAALSKQIDNKPMIICGRQEMLSQLSSRTNVHTAESIDTLVQHLTTT